MMNIGRLKALWERSTDKYGDAEKIGTTYQTMYNIIYKERPFKVDLLEKIAKFYHVPVGYFFDETDAKGLPEKDRRIAYLEGKVKAMQETLRLFHDKLGGLHLRELLGCKQRTFFAGEFEVSAQHIFR